MLSPKSRALVSLYVTKTLEVSAGKELNRPFA
jgi:hypothetical protein